MATAGFVSPLSVFRYNDRLVVGGIPWEFVCRMEKNGGAQVEYPLGNISYRTESFKLEAQRMLLMWKMCPNLAGPGSAGYWKITC